MNPKNPTVRRLLPFTLACGLLAGAAPTVEAQLAAQGRTFTRPAQTLEPTPEDKAAGAQSISGDLSCGDLLVVITGTSGNVTKVSCDHGFFEGNVPQTNIIVPGQPAVLFLQQSGAFGPDCTITITGPGSSNAVLAVQQNFCAAKAGQVTASVVSGSATSGGTAVGSFGSNLPGTAWFTLGF